MRPTDAGLWRTWAYEAVMGFGSFISDAFSGAGSALLGGALSLVGGERAREQTQSSTREQMDFQREMRSTAYQTAMQDMRKAGLNPMLAYQQGGAATPGGASYTAQDTLTPAVNTALSSRRGSAEQKIMRQQAKTAKEDTRLREFTANSEWERYVQQNALTQAVYSAASLQKLKNQYTEKFLRTPAGRAAFMTGTAGRTLNPAADLLNTGSSAYSRLQR